MLAFVPLVTGVVTSTITVLLLRRFQSPTAPAATLLFGSLSVWLFADGLALNMHEFHDRVLISKLIYPGVVAVPVAVLLLGARAGRRDGWITRRTLAALWVVPVLTLALVATNGDHGLIWSRIALERRAQGPVIVWTHGPWFWVSIVYAYLLLGAATWLLASKYRRDWQRYRTEALLVFAGLAAPWLANALYLSGLSPLEGLDATPYGFTLTAFFLAWGLAREGFLEASAVSRSTVMQELETRCSSSIVAAAWWTPTRRREASSAFRQAPCMTRRPSRSCAAVPSCSPSCSIPTWLHRARYSSKPRKGSAASTCASRSFAKRPAASRPVVWSCCATSRTICAPAKRRGRPPSPNRSSWRT